MKNEKENIDRLLQGNADEQLTTVDWERLNAAISRGLDQASRSKTSAIKFPTIFKIAAGVAAAAVILIAVMVRTDRPADVQLKDGQRAVVKFIGSKGTASIEIKQVVAKSQVIVDIGGSQRQIARCDVEIIDLNGDWKKESEQAAWIIISRPEPVFADNGVSKDVMGMIYLF